ncbi:MAG TPA: sigma-70 family RNA polymerase sigma factor [Isosphaeraceae bacterium]|jgi:RNA polymerase sigma-70 factor (ECF subfamily)
MNDDTGLVDELTRRATLGDVSALSELFARHRGRLRQMVRLRLDRRLRGRVDPSDVLQDAFVDLSAKLPEYASRPSLPIFLWLRLVVGERLLRVHRHHLGAAMRDAGREISLHQGAFPEASSTSMAAQLLGHVTSASRAALRAEMQVMLQDAINGMDPIDREVIALRHFEELTNDEVATALGLTKAAASKRYVRAMLRLKAVIGNTQGLADP